ncbi:MAG: hypothetical protein A4E19_09580 [Nitrospira sp. SG-bin1]|nr:MAG: hypothetical protein A4E19_09580 [Nitrospira sp. SG-bin1]
MVMNNVLVVLIFVFLAGYTAPDVSRADKHVLGPLEAERRSPVRAEAETIIGPVPSEQGLSRRGKQPAWNGMSLVHPDPHHLPGSEPHHPTFYRNNHVPDGAAFMFSWPFEGLTTPENANFNQENEWAGSYSR